MRERLLHPTPSRQNKAIERYSASFDDCDLNGRVSPETRPFAFAGHAPPSVAYYRIQNQTKFDGQGEQMMSDNIQLQLVIMEEDSDSERVEELTLSLIKLLRGFEIDKIERGSDQPIPKGAKGDPLTAGLVMLSLSVATIPALVTFIQNWLIERRRIVIEAPNGFKIDFVTNKKYSEEEILSLAKKLNRTK